MKRQPSCLLILLLAILVLAIAFLALDFKAARSNTAADSQVSTIRFGEGFAEDPPLVVYVEAPDNLDEPLSLALFNRVGTLAPFSIITVTDTPASEPGSAALVVAVDRRTYIWTPVYATANLDVRFAFATDGRIDWTELGEIDTVMEASPVVRQSGDLGIRDRTVGLISHPAYRNHIARQISERVLESINTALSSGTP